MANKTPESKLRANAKYQKTLREFKLRVKHEHYERIETAAKRAGKSVRAFVLDAVEAAIQSQNLD